jgi:hypothetical protein
MQTTFFRTDEAQDSEVFDSRFTPVKAENDQCFGLE